MAYRSFNLKVVRDEHPNEEGRWINRILPERPLDGPENYHCLTQEPDFSLVPMPGFHVVAIEEVQPGPSNQPGFMGQPPLFP